MILLLGYDISQAFWRTVYPPDRTPGAADALPDGEAIAASEAETRSLSPRWLDRDFLEPLGGRSSSLVLEKSRSRRSKTHATHLWSCPLPEESFYRLGNGAYVSSPCFTFLQMATELDFPELIAYGDELCGCYSLDGTCGQGMRKRRRALVSKERLMRYLASAQGCRGWQTAMRAAAFIVDNSASPMETVDEMLLCLPYRYGGYGLRTPVMNAPIELDGHASRIAKRSTCYADMCFPDIMVDLEHHGASYHDNAESFDSDRARVNALRAMGYEVIELTRDQVADLFTFEEIARHLARRQEKRIEKHALGPIPKRRELRRTLFQWNRRNGIRANL